ncbi:hypothetical protein F4780DRAFT_796323 [Xylariomycetidae sp. FL0641]|nr:hypothetical protein F4780DRAFT_796323 [Xylariomycetidae sp. FL0641]
MHGPASVPPVFGLPSRGHHPAPVLSFLTFHACLPVTVAESGPSRRPSLPSLIIIIMKALSSSPAVTRHPSPGTSSSSSSRSNNSSSRGSSNLHLTGKQAARQAVQPRAAPRLAESMHKISCAVPVDQFSTSVLHPETYLGILGCSLCSDVGTVSRTMHGM